MSDVGRRDFLGWLAALVPSAAIAAVAGRGRKPKQKAKVEPAPKAETEPASKGSFTQWMERTTEEAGEAGKAWIEDVERKCTSHYTRLRVPDPSFCQCGDILFFPAYQATAWVHMVDLKKHRYDEHAPGELVLLWIAPPVTALEPGAHWVRIGNGYESPDLANWPANYWAGGDIEPTQGTYDHIYACRERAHRQQAQQLALSERQWREYMQRARQAVRTNKPLPHDFATRDHFLPIAAHEPEPNMLTREQFDEFLAGVMKANEAGEILWLGPKAGKALLAEAAKMAERMPLQCG